jgi:cell division protein ZapA (FtsZ GTPase activity inhibitor)
LGSDTDTDIVLKTIVDELRSLNSKVDKLEAKMDAKIDKLEAKMDAKIDKLEASMDAKIDKLEASMDAKIDKLDAKFSHHFVSLRSDLARSNNRASSLQSHTLLPIPLGYPDDMRAFPKSFPSTLGELRELNGKNLDEVMSFYHLQEEEHPSGGKWSVAKKRENLAEFLGARQMNL